MNPFEPDPSALNAHRKLANVLTCAQYTLLQAKADVWEPGETPEPRPGIDPRNRKGTGQPRAPSLRARIRAVLTDQPQTISQIMSLLRLDRGPIAQSMGALCTDGWATNLARSGSVGMYVRTIKLKKPSVMARGVFDV